jgi:aminopeptidase N
VEFRERGKDLVVAAPVRTGDRHTLEVRYRGTPKPVAAPTTRDDFSTIGWAITDDGETWTMQEPFGAYSWYAVNDHPSDKALYDFTLTTRSPWVGVANGRLQSRRESGGSTVTAWHLDEPAASYLVTVAFGDFTMTRDRSKSGVPMTYWTPRGDASALRSVQVAGEELGWIEDRLGPYPFSSLGLVVVDSNSGMETQTMITLGTTDYTLSPSVVVHEMIHQWYGDQVTPRDWRDVWMNEGMAMRPSSTASTSTRRCPSGPPRTGTRGRPTAHRRTTTRPRSASRTSTTCPP